MDRREATMKDGGLSRRAALTGAAALGGAALLPGTGSRAQSTSHTFAVGKAKVTILTDGTMAAPLGWLLPQLGKEEIAAAFKEAGRTSMDVTLQVNVALIKIGADVILVDAGGGPDFAPARGKLPDNLEKAGVKPEDVTKVLFTHAHPDHLWGLIDPLDGGSMFPKARHFMAAAEVDYWLKPGVETGVPEAVRGAAIGTQRRLKELGSRIETFKPGAEVVTGITAIDTSGHTPGHVSFLLASEGQRIVIGGDALVEGALSFVRPDWRWGPDWDQDMAVKARRRLLDMLATERVPLVGYHLPWPGLGRVERAGTAFRFVQPA